MKLHQILLRALMITPLFATSGIAVATPGPEDATPVTESEIDYPETRRGDVVDELFGERIADPYRWLEADAASDPEVAAWVEAQNTVTDAYLASLPERDILQDQLAAHLNYEQFTVPHERNGRYFYTRNPGLDNQASLLVRDAVDGDDWVLIDPNEWSEDGATALAEWAPSDDGAYVAYAVQDGGTDWRTIKIIEVDTGQVLSDEVSWVRFTGISWAADGSGFFYSGYAEPADGITSQAALAEHTVYFHAIGTPQSADRFVYATPERPEALNFAGVADGGRYVVLNSTPGTQTNTLIVVDLESDDWTPRTLIADYDAEWTLIGTVDDTLYLMTSQDAERRKIVTMDLAATDPVPVDLVAEDEAVLLTARLAGERLLATYLVDVQSEVRRYALDGTPDGTVELPGIGSAGGFTGHPNDDEVFFIFTSYNVPISIYRYDVATDTLGVWAAPEPTGDLDRITVEQRFYPSKDGTEVPMFIIRRDDVTGPAPTLLYGYGGFGISMVPSYVPHAMAWVEQGGVYVVANIRGGGEYGKAWHDAARFENKQTSYDDFIAAGDYLIAEGVTPDDGLAIHGESNGGLLIGVVVNQRPDLFAAALPGVGVMDMLRFDKFTGGAYWVGDFGSPSDPQQFGDLLAYSPYHNVASGVEYPAILATTANADNRVIPAHTYKYIAAIQHADVGDRPHLVRIETRAGHGAGSSTTQFIEETADRWAFVAHWTGLEVTQP